MHGEEKKNTPKVATANIISIAMRKSKDPIKRKHEIDLTIEGIYTTKN